MSGFFKLNLQDAFKGFIVAALAVIVAGVGTIIDSNALPTLAQLQAIGIAGLIAGVSYLFKNLFTNSDGQIAKTEQK
jgi:hypothetical protein